MKRIFDLLLACIVAIILFIPMIMVAVVVKLTSQGPILYWSDRVGRNNVIFKMPKFRTMSENAPAVATHLMNDPDAYVTSLGKYLRKTSLDELPQL